MAVGARVSTDIDIALLLVFASSWCGGGWRGWRALLECDLGWGRVVGGEGGGGVKMAMSTSCSWSSEIETEGPFLWTT